MEKLALYISGCGYEERRVWSSCHFIFQVADMKREVWGVAGTLYLKVMFMKREECGEAATLYFRMRI